MGDCFCPASGETKLRAVFLVLILAVAAIQRRREARMVAPFGLENQ
jgi:hypothetical protein